MNDLFVVVGLGSMGKRRVRDLRVLTNSRVVGVDALEERRKETAEKYDVETMDNFDEALRLQPKAVFISVPPHAHYPLIKKTLDAGAAYFVECLTVLHMDEMNDLIARERERPGMAYPSCTHLFLESTKHTQKYLNQAGKIYSIQASMTSWLPNQHPWEKNMGDHYEFHRYKGGGIAEISYALSWMYNILNDRGVTVIARFEHISDLPHGFNDLSDMIIGLESGAILNNHYTLLDKHDGSVGNFERISTEKGNIYNTKRQSKYYDAQTKQWHEFKEKDEWSYEEVYVKEMRHFLDSFERGTPYLGSLSIEKEALATVLAAEESAKTGKMAKIQSN